MKQWLRGGLLAAGTLALLCAPGEAFAQEISLSLPPDSLTLVDRTAFAAAPDNWRIVGEVSADRRRDHDISTASGSGVLVNVARPGSGGNLQTAWEHGDIDLELEFMVPRGSNSGIYLQGRYELQLLDSWLVERPTFGDLGGIYQRWDESRGEGREGYEGYAPRVNAARAPGLWQTLRLEFRAPRFDESGAKVANARFALVEINGTIVHENVELNGPTRGAVLPGEAAEGPLVIQGDHGPIAFRNVRFKRYGASGMHLSGLRYAVHEGQFTTLPRFAGREADRDGTATDLAASAAGVADGFALVHEGVVDLPGAGRYLFDLGLNWLDQQGGDGTQGGARLTVGGREVLLHDGTRRRVVAEAELPAGMQPFTLELFKNREGRPASIALFVEGPGLRRQALHAEPQGRRGAPAGPITVEPGSEPYLLRGFVNHGGVKRTHVVSVGEPAGVHYTYDLQTGTLLLGWRGPFLETTQMWEGRGEPQLGEPRGSAVELPGGPTLASVSGTSIWPDSVREEARYRSHGYDLDEGGRPVFRYRLGDSEVEDRVIPLGDRRGLEREITITGAAAGLAARLAAGESIERLRDGAYLVDGAYYIVPGSGLRGVTIREVEGGRELIVPVPRGRGGSVVRYEVVW